jgi:hypothetical protein
VLGIYCHLYDFKYPNKGIIWPKQQLNLYAKAAALLLVSGAVSA